MAAKIAGIESGEYDADDDIGITYSVLDNEGYTTADTFPTVTAVAVDDAENTIAVRTENALLVRFISNGETFAVRTPENAEVDLDSYASQLGDYVRVEVFGEGGMLYTQAFLLNAAEKNGTGSVVKGTYFNLGFLDFLLAVLRNWKDVIVRFATYLL